MSDIPATTKRLSGITAVDQVTDAIRLRIADGEWPVGAMLPGFRTLAGEYGISLTSLHAAIGRLVGEGVLRTDKRRGTFVANIPQVALAPKPVGADGDGAYTRSTGKSAGLSVAGATVGIVTAIQALTADDPDYDASWPNQIMSAFERGLTDVGASTVYCNRLRGPDRNCKSDWISGAEAVQEMLDFGIDALLLVDITGVPGFLPTVIQQLGSRPIPAVVVFYDDVKMPLSHVYYDNHLAGFDAALHLIEAGCLHLVFVEPYDETWVRQRLDGVRDAIERFGRGVVGFETFGPANPPTMRGVITAKHEAELSEAHRAIGLVDRIKVSAESNRVGIVAANDDCALWLMDNLSSSGLTAGVDYAIIGFDDNARGRLRGLSTMRQPTEQIGFEAAAMIARKLSGQETPTRSSLPCRVVARLSTRFGSVPHPGMRSI